MIHECEIFLAEHNSDDFYLIREALSFADVEFSLVRAADGESALHMLEEAERLERSYGVIILALDLPKVSGLELAVHVRDSPLLWSTPVIILAAPDEQTKGSSLKTTHYFRKPSDLPEFLALGKFVRSLCRGEYAGSTHAA